MGSITYFSEGITFNLPQKKIINKWIKEVIRLEDFKLVHLNFVFCSDDYLLTINTQYLSHDYYTDIITFNSSDISGVIEGDIFISIDRVLENASSFNELFFNEVQRVMIHGVLHLLGYNDHVEDDKLVMRNKEESYLSLLKSL